MVLVAVWGGFVAVLGGLGLLVFEVWGVSMDSTPGKPHPTMVKAATCNILRH